MDYIQSFKDYLNYGICSYPELKARLNRFYKYPNEELIKEDTTDLNVDISMDAFPADPTFYAIGACSIAEKRHSKILNPHSEYYRRGVVIAVDRTSIGYVKFLGQKSFLAWRTVKNGSKTATLFGGIYEIPFDVIEELSYEELIPDKWGVFYSEYLRLRPKRFAGESFGNFLKGKSLREKLRKERKLVDSMLTN